MTTQPLLSGDPTLAAGYGPPGGPPPGGYGPPSGYGRPGGYGPPDAPPPGYGPPPGGYGPPGGFGPPPFMGMTGGPRFHALAITSLVTGILGLIPFCCCFQWDIPLPVTALITGILALGKIRNHPAAFKGGGMAIAGIVCAAVALTGVILCFATTFDDQLKQQYYPSTF